MPSDYLNCQWLPGPLVYKRRAAAAMNWLCNFVILLAVILDVDPSKAAVLLEQRRKGLLFVHQASCTYDYEVAVHTARGAQWFQLHALVSSEHFNRVKLNYIFKNQRIFFYLKACIFLRKNALVLGYFTAVSVQRAWVDKYYSTACHIARALEEIESVTSCTISKSIHFHYISSVFIPLFVEKETSKFDRRAITFWHVSRGHHVLAASLFARVTQTRACLRDNKAPTSETA